MEFEKQEKVSVTAYLSMIRSKTAALLGFSMELGAVLADAPQRDAEILKNFGINMGLAFQLKDDLLDVYGDKKKFGKQQGGDILANKKTFLLINAALGARGKEKTELQRWLAAKKFDKKRKIAAVTRIYDSLKVRALTEQKIQEFVISGFRLLDDLSVKGKANELIRFVKDLEKRQV